MKSLILIRIMTVAVTAVLGLSTAADAAVEPTLESFTRENLDRVRGEAEATSGEFPQEFEDVDGMREEAERVQAQYERELQRGGLVYDNDAAHYARGTTLVLHVFIDHLGGSWEFSERQDAGAKAALAKDYYRDNAPSNAYMQFDNEGSTAYYYIQTSVPYDLSDAESLEGWVINEVIGNLGYGDGDADGQVTDDFTLSMQGWNGGWNNLLACFQLADVNGRAWASYGASYTKLYRNSGWQTWAHEWGHLFGACDEYEENGACNGNDCNWICQSWYLNDSVPNGNCELCTGLDTCLMKYNTTTSLCDWTPRNWAWVDGDGNGQLDRTLRRDTSGAFYDIWTLYHNGWMIHTNTNWGMMAAQRWTSWSVMGVRGRGDADYDMRVYADNNQFHQLASSTYGQGFVDFVVGDFNHNRLMENHISLNRYSGSGQYVLSYESGNGVLYPDGVERDLSWDALNVVRAYDVPLFRNETVSFLMSMDNSIDLGMALYSSNGDVFYSGRSGYEEVSDFPSAGASESITFTVPEDDVYGLIVWANNEADGNFSIRVGPTPVVLAEETPFNSLLDLRLYAFVPDVPYWAVAAARPDNANVTLKLAGDSTYQDILATSGAYPSVEFIAADYHPGQSTDYLRTARISGVGDHTTEWEQSADLLTGFDINSLASNSVCRIWDVFLREGQPYFFRQYNEAGGLDLDCGIYIISSADGDRYTQRSGADGGSNTHPPADRGEWFTYNPPADDWYGYVMIKNDESDGQYSVGFGPRVSLAANDPETHPEEVLWADFVATDRSWSLAAIHPHGTATNSVALWDCPSYGSECFLAVDSGVSGTQFMAVDGNDLPTAPQVLYPRFRRETGTAAASISYDPGDRDLLYDDLGSLVSGNGVMAASEVAHIWNLILTPGLDYPVEATIRASTPDADVDLGIFALDGSGGWYQAATDAVASADVNGPGSEELVTVTFVSPDVHAIVITNPGGTSGRYDVEMWQQSTVATETPGVHAIRAVALDVRSGNPMRGRAVFDVALPDAAPTRVAVYDLGGRFVRSLADGTLAAGRHAITWDGRDAMGRNAAPGVYLVRLEAGGQVRSRKVVRTD